MAYRGQSYAKVYSYTGPLTLPGMATPPPCFRVFLPSGMMEEFGCTPNSLQYYPNGHGYDYIANWLLDLITDPQGNQIHISYSANTDTESLGGVSYPRDVELDTITYDSPGCHNAQSACSGSAWAPLVQVKFNAAHTVSRLTNTPTNCNSAANTRCDDASTPAPAIENTFALNDVLVQVRTTGTGGWNTLRDYALSYEQTGPSGYVDPVTGAWLTAAGELDLTGFQQIGDDGSMTLPARSFSYSSLNQYYIDSIENPYPGIGCGPSWNTGYGSNTCPLWSQNYANNNRFLYTASNGLGLTSTFVWEEAQNNTHGVYSGSLTDPLACTNNRNYYPCNEADDENWSRAVLVWETDAVQLTTQQGQGGTQGSVPESSVTNYTYALAGNLPAPECSGCNQGMYWGNVNDGDSLDYYNAKFMGFAQVDVTLPDNAVQQHHYYSTEGYGIYDTSQVQCFSDFQPPECYNDPWWALTNAAHGHETETGYYDTNGTTLLKQVTAAYTAVCPPSGVAPTPPWTGTPFWGNWDGHLVSELDHNNPVAACDVQQSSTTTTTYDGGSSPASSTTTTSYDAYGRVASTTTTTNGGSPTTVVQSYGYTQNDAVSASEFAATGTYLLDFQAFADTEDTANPVNRWSCTYTSYDGQPYTLGQTSGLTQGLVTETDRYTTCGTSPNYTPGGTKIATTTTYDSNGDPIASDDADANAGNTAHLGCTYRQHRVHHLHELRRHLRRVAGEQHQRPQPDDHHQLQRQRRRHRLGAVADQRDRCE